MDVKVGDRIRAIGEIAGVYLAGQEGTVINIDSDGELVRIEFDKSFNYGHNAGGLGKDGHCRNTRNRSEYVVISKSVKNKEFMSSLIEKAKLAFKGEPEKSFIKAGVMDASENLTKEGTELFLTYLLNKHGEDFKTSVVDPILKEEEDSK